MNVRGGIEVKQASAEGERADSAEACIITVYVSYGLLRNMMTHSDDVVQPSNGAGCASVTAATTGKPQHCRLMVPLSQLHV